MTARTLAYGMSTARPLRAFDGVFLMEASGKDEDYPAYWAARPTEAVLEKETSVQVVGKRCVYVNDYRVAGGKPYYTENLPNHRFNTTVRDVLDAFSSDVLKAALRERAARREHFSRWHKAREILEKSA